MTAATQTLWKFLRRGLRLRREDEITVSAETYRRLQLIAKHLECNAPAALDVVLREFTP